jgi:hypothetical protein
MIANGDFLGDLKITSSSRMMIMGFLRLFVHYIVSPVSDFHLFRSNSTINLLVFDCFPALLTWQPERDRVWFSVAFRSASGSHLKIASTMKKSTFLYKDIEASAGEQKENS